MQEKEITLEIQDLSRSGPGVARDASGRVVFVPFTAPGDKVEVEIVSEEKRYAEGHVTKLLSPSASRIKPPCPVFGRCGGCDWQHLPYEVQWRTKLAGLEHAMKRVGIDIQGRLEEFPAESQWNYRNRVQLRGYRDEIGFYAKGSKDLVPIEGCPIARPEINALIPKLREEGRTKGQPYKVEVAVGDGGQTRIFWNARHAAGGFRQVHDEQNEKLKAWVAEHVYPNSTLLDLYGGWGNLSLAFASKQKEVHCVDIGSPSANPEGTPENYHFYRSPVLPWLEARAREKVRASLSWSGPISAVLDPPREGLGVRWFEIVTALQTLEVTEILAVGCDADTWARDIHRYQRHGWKLVQLAALDLFPQTHHIEALALLRKF